MRKTLRTALASAAAVASLASAPLVSSALASRPAPAPSGLAWGPCQAAPGLDPRQRCAHVNVPLDYQNPRGPRISLAVSRISAAKPTLRQGVLVLIPGGPGNSGLALPSGIGRKLPADVLDRYDIVGFDPRGAGQSTPISCELTAADADARTFLPWPGRNGDITATIARARRLADACARHGGQAIRHISTRNEARDLDQIRDALGERRLSYWGVSYGTYVGAVYATMFPERTDRVVLDSNDDPDPTRLARGWAANFAVGARDRFPDFAAWAAARDPAYRLGGTPAAVRAGYLRLTDTLDRSPRADLTGNALRAVMFNSLYSTASFPLLASVLHAAQTGGPLPPLPFPPPAQMQNLIAVGTATACGDVAWPRDPGEYARAVARDRLAFPLTAGMPANIFACAFWPYPPAEPPTRITASGPANILMVQNRRDPATPYAGALRMRAALGGRARLVTVESGGHGAYLANGNACGDQAVSRFLAEGVRPSHDIDCPAAPPRAG